MSKRNGETAATKLEFQFPQPKQKVSWGQLIYDSNEGTYFGRTPGSWSRIVAFYVIFYIVLAGLVAICLQGLLSTLEKSEPRWKLGESLIGTNPGLGFRPLPGETERGSVIQFDRKKPEEARYWIEQMDAFLKEYNTTGQNKRFCSFNQTQKPQQVCVVDTSAFGPCSPQQGYGYRNGRPCIFLKLNRIFAWLPEYYDDVEQLPQEMPADLRSHILNTTELERRQVWVSCHGQHSLDKENVGQDSVKYYPSRGFPAFYYPYLNQTNYLSPLIAVQFEQLAVNQMVNIECRAWAKNIIYSGSLRDRQGSVAFQLFLD